MKCQMCGRTGDGESAEQKVYRLLACRKCANVEAGRVERLPCETSGVGGKVEAAPDEDWIRRQALKIEFAIRDANPDIGPDALAGEVSALLANALADGAVTPLDEYAAAASPEAAEAALAVRNEKKRASLVARGRPNNLALVEE